MRGFVVMLEGPRALRFEWLSPTEKYKETHMDILSFVFCVMNTVYIFSVSKSISKH